MPKNVKIIGARFLLQRDILIYYLTRRNGSDCHLECIQLYSLRFYFVLNMRRGNKDSVEANKILLPEVEPNISIDSYYIIKF